AIVIGASLFAVAILSWFFMNGFTKGYGRYRQAFQKEASDRLSEFFLFLDPRQLWGANIVLCVGVVLLAWLITGMASFALGTGIVALALPQWYVRHLKRRRAAAFEAQLPDLLMAMAGALRAGAGMQSALQQIVAHAPAPLSQEFSLLLREQRMGLSFEQALANLYGRMPTEG